MHAFSREYTSTSKMHVVLSASAKTTSGFSLNDQLFVGPTVHSHLVLFLHHHKVPLTTDAYHMYCAVLIIPNERDLIVLLSWPRTLIGYLTSWDGALHAH